MGHKTIKERTKPPFKDADVIVMLTWSNWFTEPRSNRYHYATRLATLLPVFFVQADRSKPGYNFEDTEFENIKILHVFSDYQDNKQAKAIKEAIRSGGFYRPLLWIYNYFFLKYILAGGSVFNVYHATEDYFSDGVVNVGAEAGRVALRQVLKVTDLLVACSNGVLKNYLDKGRYNGTSIVLENGCDYEFYHPRPEILDLLIQRRKKTKIALLQGSINNRIDFELLYKLVTSQSDWEFWICGRQIENLPYEWALIKDNRRVKYFGEVSIEVLREKMYAANVGLIPFERREYITKSSLPLKAFEYLACGLPVVTVPIDSLNPYSDFFFQAIGATEFGKQMDLVINCSTNRGWLRECISLAHEHSYSKRFETLVEQLSQPAYKKRSNQKLKAVVLNCETKLEADPRFERINGLKDCPDHEIFYAAALNQSSDKFDINFFDVIIIHISSPERHWFHRNLVDKAFRTALERFVGPRVLISPSTVPELTRQIMRRIDVDLLFTRVQSRYWSELFPSEWKHRIKIKQIIPEIADSKEMSDHRFIADLEKALTELRPHNNGLALDVASDRLHFQVDSHCNKQIDLPNTPHLRLESRVLRDIDSIIEVPRHSAFRPANWIRGRPIHFLKWSMLGTRHTISFWMSLIKKAKRLLPK